MIVHNDNNLPTIPITDLLPTQGDLKDLTDKNYNKLKHTIEKRGFSVPVYVWEDKKGILHLLDGHQRRRVLEAEGWNEPIPYLKVPAETLQEAMARLLEITSQYGTITQEGIDEFIAKYELSELEVYEATSFDALGSYGEDDTTEVEEDDVPEINEGEPAVSQLGAIYQLGRHRLMCGDSTDADAVTELVESISPDMVYTDPPYGIDHSGKGIEGATGGNDFGEILGDKDVQIAKDVYSLTVSMFPHASIIFWGANYYPTALSDGYGWIVWDKQREGDTFSGAEIAYANRGTRVDVFRHQWHGMIKASEHGESRVHPTQKPIALASWCFDNYGKPETVLDLFLGSGSTLIACEQTDRICYGMELDPKYVDVIRKRYATFIQADKTLPDNWQELTPEIIAGE